MNSNNFSSADQLLWAIAASSSPLTLPSERQQAFNVIESFKQGNNEGAMAVCLQWLVQSEVIVYQHSSLNAAAAMNVTVPVKLLACEVITKFLKQSYASIGEVDRLQLRQAVLTSCQQVVVAASGMNGAPPFLSPAEARILARTLAAVLQGLVVRDFPQRWETFCSDIFSPLSPGSMGLWYNAAAGEQPHLGVSIVLQVFRLIAEDCTDSDFNAKISTQRRNDILIGLNEVRTQFLPHLYRLLLESYPVLQTAKQTLHNMHTYLLQSNRTLQQMALEEANAYKVELERRDDTAKLLVDCLLTLEKFCGSMPTNWMLPDDSADAASSADFVAAMMHLTREPISKIQIRAVDALEQLVLRAKMSETQWMRLIRDLPVSVREANSAFQTEAPQRQAERAVSGDLSAEDSLALQLEFHRGLSRMLSAVVTAHIANITDNKHVIEKQSGPDFANIQAFLRLLVEILGHPSGRICTEQINMWISLMRDPQIIRTKLLDPFTRAVMKAYMQHVKKVRWQDIEERTHPLAAVLEASFDDEDDLIAWNVDLRARSSLLFRLFGNTEPHVAASVLNEQVKLLLQQYGAGAPLDHLEPSNNQLTELSDAVIEFEGLAHPLDNTMSGIPAWAMQDGSQTNEARLEKRVVTRSSFSEMANVLVSWNPSYLWLKFRRTTLVNSLMYYWPHEPSTLLPAVDSLLRNLGLPDEWMPGSTPDVQLSDQTIGLKKRSGVALVSISKRVPNHLVPWLSQLSQATGSLLSSQGLIPMNQMHLYEFLSCVANAVDDPVTRSNFIADVLSMAVETVQSDDFMQLVATPQSLLTGLGILQAREQPNFVIDPGNVETVLKTYEKAFSALNRLLSVGRRCNEAARKRPKAISSNASGMSESYIHFADEGPVSISQLAETDPFVVLWPKILPALLTVYESILGIWRPEHQAALLPNNLQRYTYAISDDEAFLAKNVDGKSGGVFGEGGTAGSVVSGTDRRAKNLVPRWSGWLNELRNTCFQMFGLLISQSVLFSPEIANYYPRIVAVLTDSITLQSMEHRHLTQFLKHVVEMLLTCCPSTLYPTHLGPIIAPIFEHVRYRLEKTWQHLGDPSHEATKALSSENAADAAKLAAAGGDAWFSWYYSHAGLFVGELDAVTAEAAVEKYRVDLSRTLADVLQVGFALKGEWALVLANFAKDEQARKKNDDAAFLSGPSTRFNDDGVKVNADGTPRTPDQDSTDARKVLRINGLAHYMLLENEQVAGNLTLLVIQCLGYPDAYTCRRVTKICHRILETTAWSPQYSQLLGQSMFQTIVRNILTEPKWMVGLEWAVISIARDIYCRLVLGQALQCGGQGAGQQQNFIQNSHPPAYEQVKTFDKPLLGGGILSIPSVYPRQVLGTIGISSTAIDNFEERMRAKRSAKDQKDFIRDLLREAADLLQNQFPSDTVGSLDPFNRASAEESLLHSHRQTDIVPALPEMLTTQSQAEKAAKRRQRNLSQTAEGLQAFGI
ncbi:hypothetical protein MPSEU_000336300 [Mayamaea pseudoterrestris]|nr:hypothetical protein MPSEU_000336300 [Mayamaea pseudoterrestris]